jgi:cardiolipin synthase
MLRWMNVPNALTLSRLAMVPWIVGAILSGRHALALAMFAAAAATDVADGAAARRFGQVSRTGACLDPIADKCLLSGVFLALAASGIVPWWLVVVIFGRDLYILAGAVLLMRLTTIRKFPPSIWGKASTFVQIVTAAAWLGRDAFPAGWTSRFSSATVWPCAAITVWSGLHYGWRAVHQWRIDALPARE